MLRDRWDVFWMCVAALFFTLMLIMWSGLSALDVLVLIVSIILIIAARFILGIEVGERQFGLGFMLTGLACGMATYALAHPGLSNFFARHLKADQLNASYTHAILPHIPFALAVVVGLLAWALDHTRYDRQPVGGGHGHH